MKNKLAASLSVLFIFAEAVMGIIIQINGSEILCFSSVLLALLFSVQVFLLLVKNRDSLLTFLALLCTASADFCLLILDPRQQLLAMIFFSAVQLFYFMRLFSNATAKRERQVHIILRISVTAFAVLLCVIVLNEKTDALSLVSMFYYANLLVNLIYSFKYIKFSYLMPFGLLCFILCDTLVGLSEMSSIYLEIPEGTLLYKLIHPELNLVWLFYVPSQTLLALSPIERIIKKKGL